MNEIGFKMLAIKLVAVVFIVFLVAVSYYQHENFKNDVAVEAIKAGYIQCEDGKWTKDCKDSK